MYRTGKQEEIDTKLALSDHGLNREKLEKVLEGEALLTREDEELEREAEEVLQWANGLDFDRYADEWYFKSTIFINIDS